MVSDLNLINLNTNEVKNSSPKPQYTAVMTSTSENSTNIIKNDRAPNNDNNINKNYSSLQDEFDIDKIAECYNKIQIDGKPITNNINLDNNEIIINELLLLYEDAIQKVMNKKDYIQLIKQHIVLKDKMRMKYLNIY